MEEKCISCGAVVPEGRITCPLCESEYCWALRVKYRESQKQSVECKEKSENNADKKRIKK